MKFASIFCLFLSFWANAQKQTAFLPNNLKIEWQLVTNNYKGEDKFLATFTLTKLRIINDRYNFTLSVPCSKN